MVDIKIISVIAILCLMCNYSVCDDVQESPLHCPDLKPQNNVSIDQVGVAKISSIQNKVNSFVSLNFIPGSWILVRKSNYHASR